MNSYCIVSDSCLDFSPEEMKAKGVELVPINTVMDEVEYGLNREKISLEDFFQKIKEGQGLQRWQPILRITRTFSKSF